MFNTLKHLLKSLSLLFKGYRLYSVIRSAVETDYYEDPKCPSKWRGSGCYDIEFYRLHGRLYTVAARTPEEAEKTVIEYVENLKEKIRRNRKAKYPSMPDTCINSEASRESGTDDCTEVISGGDTLCTGLRRPAVLGTATKENLAVSEKESDLEKPEEFYIKAFGLIPISKHAIA